MKNNISPLTLASVMGFNILDHIHIPVKDAPPSQATQDELITKAIAKRKRKAQKRAYDNYRCTGKL